MVPTVRTEITQSTVQPTTTKRDDERLMDVGCTFSFPVVEVISDHPFCAELATTESYHPFDIPL
jgi:hypothetical protein